MGWNGSDERIDGAKKAQPHGAIRRPSAGRGLLAGALIVALGFFALWFFLLRSPAPTPLSDSSDRAPAPIAEQKPTVVARKTPAKKEPVVEMETNRWGEVVRKVEPPTYRDSRGVLRYQVGNGRVPQPDAHKFLIKSREIEDDLPSFKHHIETEIATLITLQPGETIIGDIQYDDKFKQDFVESLMDPVKILETDSESDRQLKESVEEVKRNLADRVKNGEDLGEILQETRDEFRRVASYKNDVMQLMREEIEANAQTTADIDTYYASLNKMLESKGVEPVKMSPLMRRRLGYDLIKEREAAAQGDK